MTTRLRGKVEPLSMVHKSLPKERRHRLVIIDEAHNLRNEKRRDHRALKAYISDNDSKVLLLTATPYNKDLSDLAAQLSLFLDNDTDLGIRPEQAIAEAGELDFERACRGRTSTLAAFKRSAHLEDWQTLMSHYLIRRTRRFVEDNYADTDSESRKYLRFGDGTMFYFPKRIPIPVEREMADNDPAKPMTSDTTLNAIKDLKLPRSKVGTYLNSRYEAATPDEAELLADLREAAHGDLSGFNRIMMFKRALVVRACVPGDPSPSPTPQPSCGPRSRQRPAGADRFGQQRTVACGSRHRRRRHGRRRHTAKAGRYQPGASLRSSRSH